MSQNSEYNSGNATASESALFSRHCVLMLDWFNDLCVPSEPLEF